jgi:hypothetical protein
MNLVLFFMERFHLLNVCKGMELSRLVEGPTQPPVQWIPGALSLGLKRPGREVDRSLSISVEARKTWI